MTKSEFEFIYVKFVFLGLDEYSSQDVCFRKENNIIICSWLYYTDEVFNINYSMIYESISAPNLKKIDINGNINIVIHKLNCYCISTININVDNLELYSFYTEYDIIDEISIITTNSILLYDFFSNKKINKVDIKGSKLELYGDIFESCEICSCSVMLCDIVHYNDKVLVHLDRVFCNCNLHKLVTIPYIIALDILINTKVDILELDILEPVFANECKSIKEKCGSNIKSCIVNDLRENKECLTIDNLIQSLDFSGVLSVRRI